MTATDPRFVPSVINGRSAFIDKLTAGSATTPANATVALNATTNGADGTVIGPDDGAFQTALTTAFAVGGIVDRIDLFNIICVPGLTDRPDHRRPAEARARPPRLPDRRLRRPRHGGRRRRHAGRQ